MQQLRPDIVFLDIRMPGLTGVDAAPIAQLPPRDGHEDDLLPEIVFITAYDQYAVEAFEQGRGRLRAQARRARKAPASRWTASASAWPPAARAPRCRRRRCSSCCTSWPRS